jgi:hypothetical protein
MQKGRVGVRTPYREGRLWSRLKVDKLIGWKQYSRRGVKPCD